MKKKAKTFTKQKPNKLSTLSTRELADRHNKKPVIINKPLNQLGTMELEWIKSQFPEASPDEIKKANTPRKKYEHFTTDGKGNTQKIDPKSKDPHFRTKAEGRIVGVMPKRKVPKLKDELWNGNTMVTFFHENQIHADHTQGWFITFNTPSRKMTAADQLVLMLAHGDTEYEVQINRTHKHLIIDTLEGTLE